MKKSDIKTLEQFKEEHFGKRGTFKRDKLEEDYEIFKIGALIHEARLEKGLTQQELAQKCGTTRSFISRLENNIKEASLSSLKKIVEHGFGGRLQLTIKL